MSLYVFLNYLDVTRRHALGDATLLDLRPPVAGVLLDQDEPLALHHAVLGVALRRVLVQRFDVLELLRSAPRRDGRAFLLRRGSRADRRPAVRVSGIRPR